MNTSATGTHTENGLHCHAVKAVCRLKWTLLMPGIVLRLQAADQAPSAALPARLWLAPDRFLAGLDKLVISY